MKGSWPDSLVVSAKCFNVQQAHWQQTAAKVRQQADRCQGPAGRSGLLQQSWPELGAGKGGAALGDSGGGGKT